MNLRDFPMPDGENWVLYFRKLKYFADSSFEAEIFGGPYYEPDEKYVRAYEVKFDKVRKLELNVEADPWLELRKITSASDGNAIFEFDVGVISIAAESDSLQLVDKIIYTGEA